MGISAKTLEFLVENKLQNSREWFHGHKKQYQEYVTRPLRALCEQLAPHALAIDPDFAIHPQRVISRINRDIRFTHDKSLYRDSLWLSYRRNGEEGWPPPEVFFSFSPDGYSYGAGYYATPPAVMAALRDMILRGDGAFVQADAALRAQSVFALDGEFYKRDRFVSQPEPLKNWLNRRCVYFIHEGSDFNWLFSKDVAGRLGQDFLLLAPLYRLLLQARDLARIQLP